MFRSVRNTLSSLFGGSSSPLEEPDLEPDDYDHDLPWSADRAPTDAERRFLERAVADKHVSRDNATKQIELHAFRGARRMESSSDVYVASAGFGNEDLTTEKLERLYAESTRMMARWNQDLAAHMQREYPDKRFTFVATSVAGQEGHRSLSNTRTHHLDSDKEVKHADVYVQELVGQSPVFLGGGGNSPEATDEESPPPVTTPMVTTKQRIRVPLDEDEEDQYAPPSRSIHELIAKKPAARKKAAAKPTAPRRNEPIPGAPTLIRKKKAAATPPLPAAPTVDSQATQQMEEDFTAPRPPPVASEQREWIDTSRTTPLPPSPSASPSSKPVPPIVNRLPVVEVSAPPTIDSQATQEMPPSQLPSASVTLPSLPVEDVVMRERKKTKWVKTPLEEIRARIASQEKAKSKKKRRTVMTAEQEEAARLAASKALVALQSNTSLSGRPRMSSTRSLELAPSAKRRDLLRGMIDSPANFDTTGSARMVINKRLELPDPSNAMQMARFYRQAGITRRPDKPVTIALATSIANDTVQSVIPSDDDMLATDNASDLNYLTTRYPRNSMFDAMKRQTFEAIDAGNIKLMLNHFGELRTQLQQRLYAEVMGHSVLPPLMLFYLNGDKGVRLGSNEMFSGMDVSMPINASNNVSQLVLLRLVMESERILKNHQGKVPEETARSNGRYMLIWFDRDVINPLDGLPFPTVSAIVAENPNWNVVTVPRPVTRRMSARMSEEGGVRAPLSGRPMRLTLEDENPNVINIGLPGRPRETLPMTRDYDERTLVATNHHARRPTLLLEAPLAEPPAAEPISIAGNRQPDVDGYLRPFKMSTHASEGHGVRDRRGRDVDTVSDKGVQRHIQPEELDTERIEPLSEKSNKHMTPRIAARHRYEAALQEFERMRLTPLTEATAWNSIRTVLLSSGASEADEQEYIRELVGLIDARLLHLIPPPHPEYEVAKSAPVADEGPETPPLEPLFDFPELEEDKEEEEDEEEEEQLPSVRILDTRPLRPAGYVPLPTSPLSRLPILSASEARDIIRRVRRSARIEAKRKRRPPAKYGSVYYEEEEEKMRGG